MPDPTNPANNASSNPPKFVTEPVPPSPSTEPPTPPIDTPTPTFPTPPPAPDMNQVPNMNPAPIPPSPTIDVSPPIPTTEPPPPAPSMEPPTGPAVEPLLPTAPTDTFTVSATPPNSPKKKGPRVKQLVLLLVGGMILAGGLGASLVLVRQNQDIRQRAATVTCPAGTHKQTDDSSGWCSGDSGCRNAACFDDATGAQVTDWSEDCRFCDAANPCQQQGGNFRCIPAGGAGCEQTPPAQCPFVQGPGQQPGAAQASLYWCNEGFVCVDTGNPSTPCAQQCRGVVSTNHSVNVSTCDKSGIDPGLLPLPCECYDRQIDWTDSNGALTGYTLIPRSLPSSACQAAQPSPSPSVTPSPSPSPSPVAQCTNLHFYRVNGVVTDPASWITVAPATLIPGDTVYITTIGTVTNGTFDKARIRVNSSTWTPSNETTNKKPGSEEFYVTYTVPADGTTNFTVGAEVHEVTQDKWY